MKAIYTFIVSLLLLMNQQVCGQLINSHQSQGPPVNPGYTFSRGLIVDCADEIIYDILNNAMSNQERELIDFVRKNYFDYIILCGLEHSNVFTNHNLSGSLRKLIRDLRIGIPGIRIGIGGSDDGIFLATPDLTVTAKFGDNGFPFGLISTVGDFNNALNNSGINSINLSRTELCKFFLRAVQFSTEPQIIYSRIPSTFDDLYIEYRYWTHSSSLSVMQNEFNNFKTILSVMQILKRKYSFIQSVDTEFLPTEMFNLQAWTAIDQIDEADPLADRLIIPSLTGNVNNTFGQVCKMFHFLSDRFSKPNSQLFLGLSAESSSFNYCNSTSIPHDYLGDYLNGTSPLSGNMYSAEKIFLDKFNDPNFLCPACSCRPFADDHFTPANPNANSLSGVMWRPYSMMNDNNLFRYNVSQSIDLSNSIPVSFELIDVNGRVIIESLQEITKEEIERKLSPGIYFKKITFDDGSFQITKLFVN